MVYTTGNTLLLYNRIRKLLYGKDKKMKEQNHPNVIKIRNAHVHNLKHINVDIPLNKIVGIVGVSGSGKSSLALGVLYVEGSRRYLDALSTYTRRRMTQAPRAQVDKLVSICKALDMTLVELLCDEENAKQTAYIDYVTEENYIIELYRRSDTESRQRMISYLALLDVCKQINDSARSKKQQRNVSVIQDIDGNNIVVINDIRFKGKRSIDWKEVRAYLKKYVGDFYKVASAGDVIYIGDDLPSEYSGSKYTHSIKGTNAKAKANAVQGIPEMIEIALGKHFRENKESKHWRNAMYGWYRYDSRFAIPVYRDNEEMERYNIFQASLIVRYSEDGKLYLYDIIDIKKETSNPIEP